jgi:hypothetical protein
MGGWVQPSRNFVPDDLCVARLQPLNQVPSIYRNESSDCGAAALAMQSMSHILIAALRAEKTIRVFSHISVVQFCQLFFDHRN